MQTDTLLSLSIFSMPGDVKKLQFVDFSVAFQHLQGSLGLGTLHPDKAPFFTRECIAFSTGGKPFGKSAGPDAADSTETDMPIVGSTTVTTQGFRIYFLIKLLLIILGKFLEQGRIIGLSCLIGVTDATVNSAGGI